MIQGISHLTFIVRDLERASKFFKCVFDTEEIYSSGDITFSLYREKFFLVNGLWICIMEGDALPARSYNHVAFEVLDEDFDVYESRIRALGLEIKPSRPRIECEGRSLYFYDFDHHLFELHSGSLQRRLEGYRKQDWCHAGSFCNEKNGEGRS